MSEFLGKLTITITRGDNGCVDAAHETAFSPALDEMQGAMSGDEKRAAMAHRTKACAAAADFFLAIRDPDDIEETEKPQ